MEPNAELRWIREQMPLTAKAVARLPDLSGVRLACSMHLEPKMVPGIEGLLARGAKVFLATCNPTTVDDATVAACVERGAVADAARNMPPAALARSIRAAAEFAPTHLCEMGADLTAFLTTAEGAQYRGTVAGALEATGSGVSRLAGLPLSYPVLNWDDLPIKEGLHNRHMVGLVACHAFFERTRLTLHGKRVLVVGYGLVGRSVCDAARAYGGRVLVAERDPARALEAQFGAEEVMPLHEALPLADVVFTATGARSVIGANELGRLRDGVFLINVGHRDEEIDVPALRASPSEEIRPYLERFDVNGRRVYLFAGGSMANLTAGQGDSLNAFDVTLATMLSGLGFLVREAKTFAPGLHVLPRHAWIDVARDAVGASP